MAHLQASRRAGLVKRKDMKHKILKIAILGWLDGGMDACLFGSFLSFKKGLESVYIEHTNALAIGIMPQ
eukprot:1151343-Pelagomonas_calceolata.AAC.2